MPPGISRTRVHMRAASYREAARGPPVLPGHSSCPPYTPSPVTDLPLDLDAGLTERLARVLDVEGKIPRALDALGAGRRS